MIESGQISRFFHEKSLGIAIFFGRIGWVNRELESLGYDIEQRREALMEAHQIAAARSIVIRGNWDQAEYHSIQQMKLAGNFWSPQTPYIQPELF